MQHVFSKIIAVFLLALSQSVAVAAPESVTLNYEASRNGQPFANITETYTVQKGKYRIESVTKGIGVYALLGERRLTSEGQVGRGGLKPLHFELHQGGNPKRSLYTDFDWAASTLQMKVKGKLLTETLPSGTQDISSLIYQFM
ncbi:MAG: hypothetical protein RL194_129, partial [Pseudomonadota bacterium]